MESTTIRTNARYVGPSPSGGAGLPAAGAFEPYRSPLLDRVGDQVRERPWLPVLGLAVGAVAGALVGAASARGLVGSGLRFAGGGLFGSAGAVAAGAAVDLLQEREEVAARPAADPRVRVAEDLRVMSFNLHGAQGPYGDQFTSEAELRRLAETIRREKPDIVLLQELDRFAIRSNHSDTLVELARRLGATGAVYTPRGTLVTGRQEGTGVLTFNGVEVADARAAMHADAEGMGVVRRASAAVDGIVRGVRVGLLGQTHAEHEVPPFLPRVTTDAMLVTPAGNHVRVLSGHYTGPNPGVDNQGRQVGDVARLAAAWHGPTLLGADFNVSSGTAAGDRERALLAPAGLEDAFLAVGIPPGDERRRSFGASPATDLDRIYASGHFGVDAVWAVARPGNEPAPSDHLPIVADLRLRPHRRE